MTDTPAHDPDTPQEEVEITPEELASMKAEMRRLVEDPELQRIGQALVAGSQLYNWAKYQLHTATQYSDAARRTFFQEINNSLVGSDGVPRSFHEYSMLMSLSDLLPRLKTVIRSPQPAAADKKQHHKQGGRK